MTFQMSKQNTPIILQLNTQKRFLIAVSGGLDSMVLCQLFLENKIQFAIAHCNFQLRGEESDNDEKFVEQWCHQHQIVLYKSTFNTKKYSEMHKLSIQEAARTLRYHFFEKIRSENKIDFIVTAHHQDDQIETVLFHFLRGTGIQGLCGIPIQTNHIIRPLLPYSKNQLLEYAQQNHIPFREDSSNQKNIYTRNFIRNQLIPHTETHIPTVKQNIYQNSLRFQEINEIYTQQVENYRKKLIEKRGTDWFIPIYKLENCTPLKTIFYELLKPFHFSIEQCEQAILLIKSEPGKKIENAQFRLWRDRNFFIIAPIESTKTQHIFIDEKNQTIQNQHFLIQTKIEEPTQYQIKKNASIIQVDAGLLNFPLLIRPWKQGDYLYPLGMKKKKKISRILIDKKIPMHEKEKIWVVESSHKIVAIIGLQTDERFKITPKTKKIFIIQKQE